MKEKGFTLIELLVAAAVISLAMISMVTMVRKSQEMVLLDQHRRTAKFIVVQTLESPLFQQVNYPTLESRQGNTVTENIRIDSNTTIYGTLETYIGFQDSIRGRNDIYVPFINVKVSAHWSEIGGTRDTISIIRRVSPF